MSSTSLTIEQRLDRLYSRSQANGSTTSQDPHSGILDWRPSMPQTLAPPLLKKARHRPRTPPKTVDEEAIAKLKRADDEQITKIFAEMNDLGGGALSPVVVHGGCARSRQFVPSLQKTTFEQALKVAQSSRRQLESDDDSSGLEDSDDDDDDPAAPQTGVGGGTVCAPLPEEMPVKTSPARTSSPELKVPSFVPNQMDIDECDTTRNDESLGHRNRRPTTPPVRESPPPYKDDERRRSSDRSSHRDEKRRCEDDRRRLSSRRSSSDRRDSYHDERQRRRSRSPPRSRRYSPDRRKSETELPPAPPSRQREPAAPKVAFSPSAAVSSTASPSVGVAMVSPTVGQSNQSALVQQSPKWKDAVKLKRLADKMKKEAPLSEGWLKRQEMYMTAGLKFLEAAEMFSCAHSFQNTAQFLQNIVQNYMSAGCQFYTSIGYECCAVALYRAMQVKRKDFTFQTNQLLAHVRSYQALTATNGPDPEPLTFPAKMGDMLSSYLKHSKCAWDYMDEWDKAKTYRPAPEVLREHNLEVWESLEYFDLTKFVEHVRRALSSSFTS